MHRAFHLCAIVTFALVASPLSAQQSAPALPSADQTEHSVPPAPPPARGAQTPPPFPSFPYVEPRRRHAGGRVSSSRTVHHRSSRELTQRHVKSHAPKPSERKLTNREKKDERYCASLSKRQLRRNGKCRKLVEQTPKAAPQRPLTKQDRKDERRCASLSLRQVLRDSKCRKVAERQLAAERKPVSKSSHADKHRHASAKHKAANRDSGTHRETRKKARKNRR
jgi:hypothetical protein